LEEDEDEDGAQDEEASQPSSSRRHLSFSADELAEGTPLLKSRSLSRSRRRSRSLVGHGDASVTQAVLMVCLR
jgi:hypothetical protein